MGGNYTDVGACNPNVFRCPDVRARATAEAAPGDGAAYPRWTAVFALSSVDGADEACAQAGSVVVVPTATAAPVVLAAGEGARVRAVGEPERFSGCAPLEPPLTPPDVYAAAVQELAALAPPPTAPAPAADTAAPAADGAVGGCATAGGAPGLAMAAALLAALLRSGRGRAAR
jgi:hypothetical protein